MVNPNAKTIPLRPPHRSTIHFHCSRSDTADIGTKHAELDAELKARISIYTRNHSLSEAMSHFGLSRSTIKRYKYKHIKAGEELPDDLKESIPVFQGRVSLNTRSELLW